MQLLYSHILFEKFSATELLIFFSRDMRREAERSSSDTVMAHVLYETKLKYFTRILNTVYFTRIKIVYSYLHFSFCLLAPKPGEKIHLFCIIHFVNLMKCNHKTMYTAYIYGSGCTDGSMKFSFADANHKKQLRRIPSQGNFLH